MTWYMTQLSPKAGGQYSLEAGREVEYVYIYTHIYIYRMVMTANGDDGK